MSFIYQPPNQVIPILYMDSHLLVVEKPAGLLSVPGRSDDHKDCLVSRLEKMHESIKIVHRLDMDTSGVMVLTLNKSTHKHLSMQFEQRLVSKTYIADVWKIPQKESGLVDQPLRCDWPNRPLQMVDPELGKSAQTQWKIRETREDSARLELTPITGRSHQLRVHCQFMGHPILGDRFYAYAEALEGYDRLHLHAHELGFIHPVSGKKMTFKSDVPF